MNIFIDTNVFLSFYHLASDDLEELKKLIVLLQNKDLKLYLPSQVLDEFYRNRDNKINDALKRFREQKLSLQFPQMCKDYPEYKAIRECQQNYEELHSELLKNLLKDITDNTLKADATIHEIFEQAVKVPLSSDVMERVRLRDEVGNPPGKKDSLGDAINWEVLLQTVPDSEDIYFITDDGDYASSLDNSKFNSFLLDEWKSKKKSNLLYYRRLSTFFKDKFPKIKLADELKKELLIKSLMESPNFYSTHGIVASLDEYSEFTNSQLHDILIAATTNSQVKWILKDPDISGFYKKILKSVNDKIDADIIEDVSGSLKEYTVEEEGPEEEYPF